MFSLTVRDYKMPTCFYVTYIVYVFNFHQCYLIVLQQNDKLSVHYSLYLHMFLISINV